MENKINRRHFLREASLAGLTGMVAAQSSVAGPFSLGVNEPQSVLEEPSLYGNKEATQITLKFNKQGKFKILQLTDTHYIYGNPKSERALKNVEQMLDLEKPDLVVHTGDVIFGKPAEPSVREILDPISKRKIPFVVAFGNHDEEYDKTREELLDIVMTIPYNLNTKTEGIYGVTNCVLTLLGSNENKIKRVFYILDSNRGATIEDIPNTYGHIHFDQIAWYRQQSEFFTKLNQGAPIPSLAFFHIPLPEHKEASRDDENGRMRGTRGENVASPKINSGMFVSMKEMKDVEAVFVGHDHNSDFAVYWNNFFFIYGRFSGCDNVYNDLKPNGARVIDLTEGAEGFRSWIRLYGGEIIQDLNYP
ncbi:MAG: metallophosphoesterase family protein, partial [Massilibacteroides sp.]|nr:metallophosphoesterase family protein [Massilibacteroides sp.]MDD4661635.1 metallophosphoesterase family protein [Massilibacteroides sp.]